MTIKECIIEGLDKDGIWSRSAAQLHGKYPHLKLSSIASQLRKMVISKEVIVDYWKAPRNGNKYLLVPKPCEFCNHPPETLAQCFPDDHLFNTTSFVPCRCPASKQDRQEKLNQYYKEHNLYKDTPPCEFCGQMPIPPMMVCACPEVIAHREKLILDYTLTKAKEISEELHQQVLLKPEEYHAITSHRDMWGTTVDGKQIHGSVNVSKFIHNNETIWTDPKGQQEYEHTSKCINLGIQPTPIHGDLFMAAKLISQMEGNTETNFDEVIYKTLKLRLEQLQTVETTQGHKYGCKCKAKLCKKRRDAIEYIESLIV